MLRTTKQKTSIKLIALLFIMTMTQSSFAFTIFGFGVDTETFAAQAAQAKSDWARHKAEQVAEQERETKRSQEKLQDIQKELQAFVKSNRSFVESIGEVTKTIRILTAIYCLLDQLVDLRAGLRGDGLYTCAGNVNYQLFSLRLTVKLKLLKTLIMDAKQQTGKVSTSGAKKLEAWNKTTDETQKLNKDIEEEIRNTKAEIAIQEQREQREKDIFNSSMASFNVRRMNIYVPKGERK